ncbi:MAG: hypothetical protein KDK78_07275, partial [Chlamydiia bacterium]|nr:hypothetical protein [Chlamydiia bacterium]
PDRDACYDHYFVIEASDSERQFLLDLGYRAFGKYYFRPCCTGCHLCVPLRVPIGSFKPSKSQRRVWNRCSNIRVEVGVPQYSNEKYAMYCEHLERFQMNRKPGPPIEFQHSFYDPEFPALEFSYYLGETLIAVGIVHETEIALSSVYFYYRLDHSELSLGTFGVLQEIEYARLTGKRFLYLGYWIRDNRFMRYKAEFRPNEILDSHCEWKPFRTAQGDYLIEPSAKFNPPPSPLFGLRQQ